MRKILEAIAKEPVLIWLIFFFGTSAIVLIVAMLTGNLQ